MIEMLGVLAVVGVLSIVGIAGFRSAMDKHRASKILNEAHRRAVIISGQKGFHQSAPSLEEFINNTFAGGTFDTAVVTDPAVSQFGLKVSKMPEKICQNILSMISEKTVLRRLASEENIAELIEACTEPDGTYLMVYNDDLGTEDKIPPAKVCREHSDCRTTCGTCNIAENAEEGICVGECDSECIPGEDACGENECIICDEESKTCKDRCIPLDYLESTGTQ
ncbi:MAG: hypothetical protein J6Y85_04755 [Alphaproteobacteria bacterium]|nr:hypothetical protein [Alphaproteobacteria bacterium]